MDEREMDIIKMEAEADFMEMMEEFQRAWLGRRAEYGSQETDVEELQGEVGGQLVQYSGAGEDAEQEPFEGQPSGQEIGAGAGNQNPFMGKQLPG